MNQEDLIFMVDRSGESLSLAGYITKHFLGRIPIVFHPEGDEKYQSVPMLYLRNSDTRLYGEDMWKYIEDLNKEMNYQTNGITEYEIIG